MPETIRTANERLRSRPRRGGHLAAFFFATFCFALGTPAHAATGLVEAWRRGDARATRRAHFDARPCSASRCSPPSCCCARGRTADAQESAAQDEAATLRAEIERLKALLLAEPQVLVAWAAGSDQPEIFGDTGIVVPGALPENVLAFGAWLEPAAAQRMQHAVDTLRNEGRGFTMTLTTSAGRPLEAEGRAVAGRAVLRLRDVSGIESELMDLASRHDRLLGDVETMKALLDALPAPIWARGADGRLIFVNAAYARAVEAEDPADAVTRELELLDRAARDKLDETRADGALHRARLPAIVAGNRRIFDVVDAPSGAGSAGMAVDATEVEAMRTELARMIEAHRRVLDQLATGVAIFNVDRKLIFYNSAFRSLFDLDAGLLDQTPTDSAVLDTLRANRKLPEEQDFRLWKQQLYEAYRAVEPQEHMWHLPDGRTLRVVTAPNPEGGVTYLYDDVTERLDMHRRYDALIKVQSETLDHLAEAVAVFGSDGRVRLHNPAFQRMWKLAPESLDQHPHVEAVTAWCAGDARRQHGVAKPARRGHRHRRPRADRRPHRAARRHDDRHDHHAAARRRHAGHLPGRQRHRERRARADRKERGAGSRRRHQDRFRASRVYELRSPLTNIIGFANLLGDPAFGPLTDKQHEYLGYITTSTNALLALINNILDLATIDAGAMALNLTEVDIRASMEEAAEGVQDRLVKDDIKLAFEPRPASAALPPTSGGCGRFCSTCCPTRSASRRAGATVTLAAERRPTRWCSPSPTAGPAFRPRPRTECSTGSRPIRWARPTAAPAWAFRWCAPLSSCTAAR